MVKWREDVASVWYDGVSLQDCNNLFEWLNEMLESKIHGNLDVMLVALMAWP